MAAASSCVPQLSACLTSASCGSSQGLTAACVAAWAAGRASRCTTTRAAVEGRWALGGVSSSGAGAVGASRGSSSGRLSGIPGPRLSPRSLGRDSLSTARSYGSNEGRGGDELEEPTPSQPVEQKQYLEFPQILARKVFRYDANADDEKPMVRVRLSVHYRCHSRQMLCIGGSNIPFGWSFLSIAKVPMSWTEGDIWVTEVDVPAGTRLEYKYVILEEQDWTKQENDDVEGVVTTFRVTPGEVPDVQSITKKMAIVAWQPGPNRVLIVPQEEEFAGMVPGEVREREFGPMEEERAAAASRGQPRNDVIYGSWEAVMLQDDSSAMLERKDVWGYGDWNMRQQKSRSRF